MSKPHKLQCEKVIEENIGLVKSIVQRFKVSEFDKDDLMQAGLIGLWKAAYHYDEKYNVKFSTFACKYILGEIKEEMKKFQIIKISRKYFKIIKELKNNEKIDEDLIMRKTLCEKKDIIFAYNLMNNVSLIEDTNQIMDNNYCNDSINSLYNVKKNSKEEKIIKVLEELKYQRKTTQKEIASRLMISQSTVSRLLKKININN